MSLSDHKARSASTANTGKPKTPQWPSSDPVGVFEYEFQLKRYIKSNYGRRMRWLRGQDCLPNGKTLLPNVASILTLRHDSLNNAELPLEVDLENPSWGAIDIQVYIDLGLVDPTPPDYWDEERDGIFEPAYPDDHLVELTAQELQSVVVGYPTIARYDHDDAQECLAGIQDTQLHKHFEAACKGSARRLGQAVVQYRKSKISQAHISNAKTDYDNHVTLGIQGPTRDDFSDFLTEQQRLETRLPESLRPEGALKATTLIQACNPLGELFHSKLIMKLDDENDPTNVHDCIELLLTQKETFSLYEQRRCGQALTSARATTDVSELHTQLQELKTLISTQGHTLLQENTRGTWCTTCGSHKTGYRQQSCT